MKTTLVLALGLLAFAAANPAMAKDVARQSYENLLTPLLESGQDVLGHPLAYPDGTPNVTSAKVTLAPGAETGWHLHQVPLFAYVLEGELTVDYGANGTKTYRAGDAVLEAMNWPHNGTNTGAVPMTLIAVYMGSTTMANTEKASAP